MKCRVTVHRVADFLIAHTTFFAKGETPWQPSTDEALFYKERDWSPDNDTSLLVKVLAAEEGRNRGISEIRCLYS